MLETSRLILRPWEDKDKAPFAALNADPDVMRFFPAPLQRTESDNLAARFQEGITERGWGFWAVELKETQQLLSAIKIPFSLIEEKIVLFLLTSGYPLRNPTLT